MNATVLLALFLLIVNLAVYTWQGYPWYVIVGWLAAIYATWKFRGWALQ